MRPGGSGDPVDHAGHKTSNVDVTQLEWLTARKRHQTLHQRLGPVGGLQRPFDPALLALIAASATMQHVQAADDRRQEIVEVVCYAPDKLAHGLELLRLAQIVPQLLSFLLRLFLRAQVLKAVHGAYLLTAGVEERCDIDENRHT